MCMHSDTDKFATGKFLRLTLKPILMSDAAVETRSLELTLLHFVPVSSGLAGNLLHRRSQDIRKGDKLWALGARTDSSSLNIVTSISEVAKQGLNNPFTLGGTTVVNGVVASMHSDWFLDSAFQFFNLVTWLPLAYQLVLFPVRMLYHGLGRNAYILLYQRLDSLVELSAFGGRIFITVGAASGLAAILMMSKVMISLPLGY